MQWVITLGSHLTAFSIQIDVSAIHSKGNLSKNKVINTIHKI